MDDGKVSDLHKDMLAEIFNMGMGQAVNAISQLSGKGHEVAFELPSVEIIEKSEFIESISGGHELGIIIQTYHGDLKGKAYMYYPHISGKELAKLLIGTELPSDQIERLESDALLEIGNIFINASLASLANFIGKEIKTDLPQIVFSNLIGEETFAKNECIIQLNSKFMIDHMNIDGKVAFVLGNESLESLLQRIDEYLQEIS
jgi:chemotaxis protein CheC